MFDSPYGRLRDYLADEGIEIHTYDKGDLVRADKVLCFNYNPSFLAKCQALGIPRERMVLFAFEPAVVIPQQHSPKVWEQFGMRFTVRDDLVDNKQFFRLRFPQGQELSTTQLPGFAERRFLTLINALARASCMTRSLPDMFVP